MAEFEPTSLQDATLEASHDESSSFVQDLNQPIATHEFTMLQRVRAYCRVHSLRYLAGLITVILSVLVMILPSPYALEMPGPTYDVLDRDWEIIDIQGSKTYTDSGQLRMLTVSAAGVPGYPFPNFLALIGWASDEQTVIPQEAVFPVGQTVEEYEQESAQQMSESKDSAIVAAFAFLEQRFGMETSKIRVNISIDDVGGPSAGMMYTLGIIDLLTPATETNGLTIAGTGTIDDDGVVGAIGGIRLKMIGAKRDGATWFLAPQVNCDEVVGGVPDGLRDVAVSTLDEAYEAIVAIGKGEGETLPHCTVS